jgi:hypothetical protein
MPDALKYYFSKSNLVQGSLGLQKSFEYIVQGMQEGEWEVPAQQFIFFDVENRSYKMLETAPLLVTVLQGQAAVPVPASSSAQTQPSDNRVAQPELVYDKVDGVLPMNGALSLARLLFLLFLPPALFGLYELGRSDRCMAFIAPRYSKRRAVKRAHADLARAYRHHNVRAIHGIFVQLCAQSPEQIVAAAPWSDAEKAAWLQFYEKITLAAYAEGSQTKEVVRLFHEAEHRLTELERVI